MNQLLTDRRGGLIGNGTLASYYLTRSLYSLAAWPHLRFDGEEAAPPDEIAEITGEPTTNIARKISWAHQAGVNSLAVEPFEHKLMLSGGADPSIRLWDLESTSPSRDPQILRPLATVKRTSDTHKFGITHLSWYPFEPTAFLSSSYDHTLKIYSTATLQPSASFKLEGIVYSHALSPIAQHLLVATCTQHPILRLVDLHSGTSTHSLAGHSGAVLAAAWSPRNEFILASGGIDGTVLIWDVRQSRGTLSQLDLEDSLGLLKRHGQGSRASAKAHNGPVNGVHWTDDGNYIVTAGHDNAVRVWDASTGANTLANFGPSIRNAKLETKGMLTSNGEWTGTEKQVLIYPNEGEVLVAELHEGRIVSRLRVPGPREAVVRAMTGTGERHVKRRVTSLSWLGPGKGFVSGGSDGVVRVWGPMADEDAVDEMEDEGEKMLDKNEKRKREVLDEVFKDLTKAKITFG
jgi:DNA excision repair protein ERCC-8